MVRKIALTQGQFALIDDEDAAVVSGQRWFFSDRRDNRRKHCYATSRVDGKWCYMHRMIASHHGFPAGDIDHIDGDGLNNRKSNLRVATASQNNFNKGKQRGSYSSRFIGVSICKTTGRWKATINVSRKQIWLGRFDTEVEAAQAYDLAARQHHGSFSRTNLDEGLL